MKKNNFIIATLLVAVAASVAFVSCKKESQDTLLNNNQPVKAFTVPQVDDMNAYLKEFKQKMMESQNSKDAEYLSLEEAAWHLAGVANYDFGYVNVRYTDLYYDTLYYQVNVTNGQVLLSDLNAVYASMASDIDELFQNLDLQEKHIRLVVASISENGQIRINLTISYIILDHTWYFDDDWGASSVCYALFDQYTNYVWNASAISNLEYALNLLESRDYIMPNEYSIERDYYLYTMVDSLQFQNYIDIYGSPFLQNSRIFAANGDTYATPTLDLNTMCYCLDSYLGLGFEYVDEHNLTNQRPVHWEIGYDCFINQGDKWHTFYHVVKVTFAILVTSDRGM